MFVLTEGIRLLNSRFLFQFVLSLGLFFGSWIYADQTYYAVKVLDCRVLLGSPAKPHRLALTAGKSVLSVEVENILHHSVSTVTYSFDTILTSLRMTPEEFRATFAGKRVLLVGEGFGALLPEMLKVGALVKAVDPIYGLEEVPAASWQLSQIADRPEALRTITQMQSYLERYDEYIFPGVSSALPFPNESFDFVISHMLVNNFMEVDHLVRATFIESARVLVPGGKALHAFAYNQSVQNYLFNGLGSLLNPAALAAYKLPWKVSFALSPALQTVVTFQDLNGGVASLNADKMQYRMQLLTITRPEAPGAP